MYAQRRHCRAEVQHKLSGGEAGEDLVRRRPVEFLNPTAPDQAGRVVVGLGFLDLVNEDRVGRLQDVRMDALPGCRQQAAPPPAGETA